MPTQTLSSIFVLPPIIAPAAIKTLFPINAMTANRVYRKQLDMAYVIQELKNGRGTQFDPGLVDVMLGLIDNGKIDICSLYKEHTHTDHSREKEEE